MRYILLLLLIAWPASAGGSYLMMLGQPNAHPVAAANGAAFTVGVTGCGVNYAEVRATAEGLVDGKRRSIPLKLTLLSEHAGSAEQAPRFTMAVPRTLPSEGVWVIHVVGRAGWGAEQQALVVLAGEGFDRGKTRLRSEPFSPAEITAALSR